MVGLGRQGPKQAGHRLTEVHGEIMIELSPSCATNAVEQGST